MRDRHSATLLHLSGLYFADMWKSLLSPFAATKASCIGPGWPWFGYMAFGVAFWTGVGFGILGLNAHDKTEAGAARRSQRISRTTGTGRDEPPRVVWHHRAAGTLGEQGAPALNGTNPEIHGRQRRGFIVIDGGRAINAPGGGLPESALEP